MFRSLDFLYIPAPDIHSSVEYYTNVLGGELWWKIHAFGVWVACIKMSENSPLILLADHIEKKDPIMIYRVEKLRQAANDLRARGWKKDEIVEIPLGPCYVFRDPAGNAIAIYENSRAFFMDQVKGRIDLE